MLQAAQLREARLHQSYRTSQYNQLQPAQQGLGQVKKLLRRTVNANHGGATTFEAQPDELKDDSKQRRGKFITFFPTGVNNIKPWYDRANKTAKLLREQLLDIPICSAHLYRQNRGLCSILHHNKEKNVKFADDIQHFLSAGSLREPGVHHLDNEEPVEYLKAFLETHIQKQPLFVKEHVNLKGYINKTVRHKGEVAFNSVQLILFLHLLNSPDFMQIINSIKPQTIRCLIPIYLHENGSDVAFLPVIRYKFTNVSNTIQSVDVQIEALLKKEWSYVNNITNNMQALLTMPILEDQRFKFELINVSEIIPTLNNLIRVEEKPLV